MKINENLELLGGEGTFNIYSLSENSLKPYELEQDDISFINVLVKAYDRSSNSVFSPLVNKSINNIKIINMPIYPLPGFCLEDGSPVVNLSPINASQVSDYTPPDLYASFVYSIVFGNYIKNKLIDDTLEDQVSLFIFNSFMTMFGKKAGLVGSFSDLAPKLRFIISCYVRERFFGYPADDKYKYKISIFLHVKPESLKLNYDFNNPAQFLRCIRDNNIMSISENKFSSDVMKTGGIISIPMYEDVSRLFSTVLATSIKGNNIFSSYWSKKSKSIFEKMYFYGIKSLK